MAMADIEIQSRQALKKKIKHLPKPLRDAIAKTVGNLETARGMDERLDALKEISDAEWEAAEEEDENER
jgi:hypothetical protein